ncbi:MAG: monofunctional biosynthetic peptidoglycan transglycosylase [Phycisphaerae bacterium]|nr:monofunctional biosynthetic peptidoglycan transglycosylase [Gemmatimonadaceae bacterium]
MARTRKVRTGWRKWVWRAFIAGVVVLLLPVPVVLSLAVLQPPTTAIIVKRAAERLASGKRPIYPRRTIVSRGEISPHLRRAVLASEDDRFFLHFGFDLVEIDKALEKKKRGGRLRGASTLTQQVAKNIFLWEGRSYVRKGMEAYLTLWLELLLTKERILDLYLNLAEWGDGVFGAEAAARKHYGKAASKLTREEAARLAAILPSPLRWSPSGSVASLRIGAIMERMQYAAPRTEEPMELRKKK